MGAIGFGEDKSASRVHLTEQWNLQGRWRWGRWKVSRLGGSDNYLAPDPEQIEKLLALIRQRQRLELTSQAEDTVVVGTADFQPVSFMQEGAARSRAVCRIAREFSLPEFRRFIEEIQQREDLRSFSSVRKLVEIFSIPAEVVKDIFVDIQGLILDNLDKDILVDIQRSLLSNLSDSALSSYAIELRSKIRQSLSQKNLELNNFDQYGSLESLQEAFDEDNAVANIVYRLGYLEALKVIDASILAKLNPLPVGTGFLVGGNHILTNQHVIPDEKVAEQCIAQFNYIQDARGHTQASIDFGLSPRDLFFSNPDLDYTLVQVNTGRFTKQAGYDLGWITMAEDAQNITPGWFALDVTNTIPISEIKSKLEQYLKDSLELKNKAKKSLGSGDEQQLNKVLAELNQDMRVEVEQIDEGWAIFIDHPFLNQSDLEGLLVRNESNIISLLLPTQSHLASQSIIRNPITAKKGDVVFIIQHPRGQEQQIVLSDNQVILNGLYRNFLRYRADSDYGSSGSPVFNEKWQLVALHHAAIGDLSLSDVMAYNTSEQSDSPNQPSPTASTAEASTPQIYAQQGVRICRILEDLKQKSLSDPKLRNFIDDFAVTVEQLNYPPLPAALEFDGVRSFVSVDGEVAVTFAGTRQDGTVDLVEWSKGGVQLSHLSLTAGEVDEGETFGNRVWLSQDGQKIAVAGQKIATQEGDRYPIELRDRTGDLLHTFTDHPTPITCACFSPDDNTLAVGCKDGSVRLWDCQKKDGNRYSGKLLAGLLHTSEVLDITFSPDGKTLVASSPDEALMICQQTDNQWSQPKKRILEGGHIRYSVSCYNVSSDGKTFVSGDEEGWVKLWNPETGQLRYTLPPHGGKVSQLTFTPDNRYLACVVALSHEELAVTIWELSDNQRPQLLSEKDNVAQFAFTQVQIGSDFHTVATYLSTTGTVTLETLHRSPQLLTKKENVAQFVFTPVQIGSDSYTVAAYLSKAGIVTLENLQGSLLHQWDGTYDQISMSPDSQTLVALTLMEPIWQSNPGEFARIIVNDPTFGPNPDVWTYTAKLWRLRWENNTPLQVTVNEIAHPLTQHTRIIKTLLSPKSQQVLAMVFDLSGVDQSVPIKPSERTWSLKRWNLSDDTKEQILLSSQCAYGYAFPGFPKAIVMGFGSNQTDEFFAISIYDQNASPQSLIHLWTAETTQPVSLPYFEDENADQIVFNLEAQVLIAASQQARQACLWRLDTTGSAPTVIETKDVEISYEVLVSPTHLLSKGENLKVKIWEVNQFFANPDLSPEPREMSLWIRDGSYNSDAYSDLPLIPTRLSFNPTGEMLGAANSGGGFTTWSVENPSWDVTTNQPSRTFHDLKARNYGYWFRSLQLSPDGDIITAVANKRVRVWNSEGEQLGVLTDIGDYAEVAISPDSHLIVTVDSSQVKIRDRSGNALYKGTSGDLYDGHYTKIAITPDSQVIIIAGNQTIKCWDRRGKEVFKQTYDDQVFGKYTSPEFYFVPTVTSDYPPPPIMAVKVSDYAYSVSRIFLYEWIVRGKNVQITPLLDKPIPGADAVGFSHDGAKLVTGNCSNEFNDEDRTFKVTAPFTVWDIKTGQPLVTSPLIPVGEKTQGKRYISQISFSPDDEIVFYTLGEVAGEGASVHPPIVYLWRWKDPDISPISLKHSHRTEDWVWDFFHFDFSPDLQHLVVIDGSSVEVWNRKTGWDNLVEGLREQPKGRLGYPQFMPDGKSILFTEGTSVKRWNLEHGQSQVFAIHSDTITHFAINKNGTIIATASADSTVKLWDSKGNLKKTFSDLHLANSLSFFSDNTVFTSGKEGAIKAWKQNVGNGSYTVSAERQCHDAEVLAMAVNESAMMLASAGQEGVVKFWRVNPAKVDRPPQISLLKLPSMPLPFNQQGYVGGSLKVNPAHPQLNASTDTYSFGGDRPFSIEAWVNPYPDGFGGTVIGKWREDNEGEYLLAATAQGKVLFSRLAPESFQQAYTVESILPISFGQFHHLAVTYDSKVMRLYIDGQLDQQTFLVSAAASTKVDDFGQSYIETNDKQLLQIIEPTQDNDSTLQLKAGTLKGIPQPGKQVYKAYEYIFSSIVERKETTSAQDGTEITIFWLRSGQKIVDPWRDQTLLSSKKQTLTIEKIVKHKNHLVLWTTEQHALTLLADITVEKDDLDQPFLRGVYNVCYQIEETNLDNIPKVQLNLGELEIIEQSINGVLTKKKRFKTKQVLFSFEVEQRFPNSGKDEGGRVLFAFRDDQKLADGVSATRFEQSDYGLSLTVDDGSDYLRLSVDNGKFETDEFGQTYFRKDSVYQLEEKVLNNTLALRLNSGSLQDVPQSDKKQFTPEKVIFSIRAYELSQDKSETTSAQASSIRTYQAINDQTFETKDGQTFSVEKVIRQGNQLTISTNGLIAGKQRTDLFTPTLIGAHFSDPAQVTSAEQVTTGFFKGIIAEIRIWDQAITTDQIQRNQYRRLNPSENPNLIGYWRFEEGMGDRITNLALATKRGIIQNTQWLNTSGAAGLSLPGALVFNGKDAYVYCGIVPPKSPEKSPVPVTPAVTIEAWVNPMPGAGGTIVSRWQENSQEDYLLSITPEGQPQFARLSSSRQIQSSNPISFGQFHHLAASYDGDTMRLYVDGELARQTLTLLENAGTGTDDFDQSYLRMPDNQLFHVEYPSLDNNSTLKLHQGTLKSVRQFIKPVFKAEEEIFSFEINRQEVDLSPEGNERVTFWLQPGQSFEPWSGEALIAEKVVRQDNQLVLWTTDQQVFLFYENDYSYTSTDYFGYPFIETSLVSGYQLKKLQSGDNLIVELHQGILQTIEHPIRKTRFKSVYVVFSLAVEDSESPPSLGQAESRTIFKLRNNQEILLEHSIVLQDATLLQESGNLTLTAPNFFSDVTFFTNASLEEDSFGQMYFYNNSRFPLLFQLDNPTADNQSRLTLKSGTFEYIEPPAKQSFTLDKELFSFDIVRQELGTSVGGVATVTYWLGNDRTFQTEDGQKFLVEKVVQQGNALTLWATGLLIGADKADQSIPIVIGAHLADPDQAESSNAMTGFFNGAIAEVKIWNQALSEDEIRANRNRPLDNPQDNPHLLGYWRFEEGVGDRITNLANPTANVTPVPSYGKSLNIKRLNASQFPTLPLPFSLQFNGESAYVDCGDVPQLTEAVTVEAWVKHSYGDGLIVHRGGGWNESGYSLYWYRGKIRVELQDASRETKLTIDTQENAPSDNTWHHIAFTWTEYLLDEEGNPKQVKNGQPREIQEVEVYIDGRRQNVIAVTGESKSILSGGLYKSVGIFKGSIGKQSVSLTIGGMAVEQAQDKQKDVIYFDGAIAEVRLWKVARTQNEIKANMYRRLNSAEEGNLVGYWRLDEEVKQTLTDNSVNFVVRDLTSNQHHGKVYGASWFPSADAIASSPSQSSALPLPEPDSEPDSELEKAPDLAPSPAPSPAPDSESGQESEEEQEQELSPAFKDISTHWAETRILELVGRDIVKGYPDRTFRPDTPMKRAEFAALLVKTFNPTPDSFTVDFIDVPTDFWAHSAIQQVCSSKLMIGISGNQFVPNASLTRLQAIIILVVCLLRQEKPLPIPNFSTVRRSNSGIFNDIEDLRDEAHIAIAIAVELKIIAKPSHKQLLPHYRVTRAQVAAMLSRVLQFLES